MKKIRNFAISAVWLLVCHTQFTVAQSIDEERMNRDIEVAENVLATLIKHELGREGMILGLDVKGTYQPGYGVTFRLPPDHSLPFVISVGPYQIQQGARRAASVIANGFNYSYSISASDSEDSKKEEEAYTLNSKTEERAKFGADSVRKAYNDHLIDAATNFILDYGDLISQLRPEEKIVVTNQSDRPRMYFDSGTRTRISVEGKKADITALKQGKLSRAQAVKNLTVVNTESVETKAADLEVLSTIFTRLYHPDVSKTYFIDGNVYYERLKDYGAVYYLRMISSIERNLNRFFLPTQGLDNLNQEERDKKVKELYPAFEQGIKENILEYGRTLKSLDDDEQLVFNISLTKCTGCGIPSTLELRIPASVLKNFDTGKIDKANAMGKFEIRKGTNQ